jgi:hypothetical protein
MNSLQKNLKQLLNRVLGYPYTITIAIVLFFLTLFWVTAETKYVFRRVAKNLVDTLENSEAIRHNFIQQKAGTNHCTQALYNQYLYIDTYKQQHLHVATNFETYYFAFVLILTISAVIASIMAVLIGRTGWQNQTPGIKAAFIGFFFTASLTGVLMNTFNNADNVNKNISKYFYFTNLQTNIYDVLAVDTAFNRRCADSSLLRVFWDNNKSMKDNMNLFLDIKADKIPSTDIGKTVH